MHYVPMVSPLDALAHAVERARAASRLTQVTVVVPNHQTGRDVLHHLARTGAIANTNVLTVPQLLTRLAAPSLTPRQPLPYPLLEAAVERVLTDQPGLFADVSTEPITAQALASAIAQLSDQESPHIDNPMPVVAEMLRIREQALARFTDRYYLAHEAYAAARARLDALGEIVIYAPNPTSPAEDAFLADLQARGTTVELEPDVSPTQVIHTSDADDEVRAGVRLVRKHLANGVPGHRIGIFYGTDDPYLPLLHEHLTDGQIAFSGPECHSLVDRPIGRSILGLLELDHEKMPRRELFAILAEGAMRRPTIGDQQASLRKLETLTRRHEPIVGGIDWERLNRVPADHSRYPLAAGLWEYVNELRSDLAGIADADDWQTVADGLNRLLNLRFRIPVSDVGTVDLANVRADCAALAHMDGIAPAPNASRIRDALDVRFRAHGGVHGRSGVGLSIAPLNAGVGRDLDVSIVIGAADGIIPAPRREDPLLPPELLGISPRDHITHQHRAFASALSSGRAERIVTFPRGNLRGGAEKVPSRWLIPALASMAGKPVTVVDWLAQTRDVDSVVAVDSFDVAAQTADPRIGTSAASATEWRLRELAAVPANRRQGALDDRRINLGMQMRSDRLNGRFTRFNGNVADARNLLTVFDNPVPPTGLEAWVQSPYRFFLQRVLGLRDLPDPDEVAQLDALTKGSLIHEIFERYVLGTIAGDELDHGRLQLIADEILNRAEADSPGWLAQLWAKDRGAIVRDLTDWHTHDTADHTDGWHPTSAEQKFGVDSPLTFDLGDATISFAGSIDRIDQHRDGRIRVTDYKTGQAKFYKDITEATPTNSGKQFQLPTYGVFARTLGENVSARYWFASSVGGFDEIGYDITDPVVEIFRADLRLVHREIMAGHFPPKTPDTFWEDPIIDLIGRTSLRRAWASLENVTELAAYTEKYGAQ